MAVVFETLPKVYSAPEEGNYEVNASMALYWFRNHEYPRQRPHKPWHVSKLAHEMVEHRFRQKTQVSFCKHKGHYYLTNGQHTLRAIAQCNVTQKLSVIVTDCDHMEDVDADYIRQDSNLTRQLSDTMVAHSLDKRLGVSRSQLSRIISGCFFYDYLIGDTSLRSTKTNDTKLELILKHGELARHALFVLNGFERKPYLTRRSTLACVMHTLNGSPDKANEFWSTMSLDDGLRADDPRKQVLEYLRDTYISGKGSHCRAQNTPEHIVVKAIAKGWNSFVEEKPIGTMRVNKNANQALFATIGYVSLL